MTDDRLHGPARNAIEFEIRLVKINLRNGTTHNRDLSEERLESLTKSLALLEADANKQGDRP